MTTADIRRIRKKHGTAVWRTRLTYEQLGLLLGVSKSYAEKMGQGQRPITPEMEARLVVVEGMSEGEVRGRLAEQEKRSGA